MAIQDKKIPKPSDIKSSPISFSEQELKEIKDLRLSLDTLVFQLGQISVEQFKLEEQEINLKNKLKDLAKKEISIAKKLTTKYGKGSIDIETGKFIPS
jgi:predicted FMN-binding regulatory protein PaiB